MSEIKTLYGTVSASVFEKCKTIKLVVFDVDGVFSDGNIYMGNNGEELKAFNTKDGYGIKALASCGIQTAVITGRQSNIVEKRMQSLNVNYIIQGREDKNTAMIELMEVSGFKAYQIASMGDDMPDLGLFAHSAIKASVNDAHPMVKREANYITSLGGGKGAVREFCDLFLQVNNKLEFSHGASL
ncbi:3-deoxy-manno-octulosonate-8-phosphatase KdsC [Glaciecola petra]|uniref:3-deoxy-D-manno-octulosonate 8-phosphate phosphatase KdsC n=1 Tax=Glaciecola petra TaxID=3075602 RepID=A0ABU2ZUQ9_9ALTE|nr:3-deoxy-manno-octulosonate-8-phosphatase KdsC [Aestuariibacter sp. P117]MDT0595991.1 3-deoxy-manno-octulosonate-8-phosphatase KdsC [Aestuariibacter sp. P117]